MSQPTVRVIARITAQPGKEAELDTILRALIAPTRQEAGCISYQLLRHQTDTTEFTFVEEWQSDAAIDAHFETPHLQNALAQVAELLACAPDIRRYAILE